MQYFHLFVYFWLHWFFTAARGLLSSRLHRLLVAVASLVPEHGLLGTWASVVVAHRF